MKPLWWGRCWSELNGVMVCEIARAWMRGGHVRGLGQLMDSQRAGSPSEVRLAITEGCKTLMNAWALREGHPSDLFIIRQLH